MRVRGEDRGLPPELTYLPIVESSYDMSARSSVGALGIWQFMPRTGREYMRVNSIVDERLDPIESSRAAASYLQAWRRPLGFDLVAAELGSHAGAIASDSGLTTRRASC